MVRSIFIKKILNSPCHIVNKVIQISNTRRLTKGEEPHTKRTLFEGGLLFKGAAFSHFPFLNWHVFKEGRYSGWLHIDTLRYTIIKIFGNAFRIYKIYRF